MSRTARHALVRGNRGASDDSDEPALPPDGEHADNPVTLDPDDIDAIAAALAPRVAALLTDSLAGFEPAQPQRYVEAATVAKMFGVERGWVYAHKHELGAIRLPSGRGERGRLRFDVQRVAAALEAPAERPALTARAQPPRGRGRRRATGPQLIPYEDAA